MSGLEPTYTNIIKQELEIGYLRRALALVTGKLERLQQFVDRSEWGQERDRLTARITELERDLEGCHRSNAELMVCGAENCEPYRALQSQLATVTQQYTAAIQHIEELVTTPRAAQVLSQLIQAERDIESLQQCQCDGCEERLEGDAYCIGCVVKLREQITALQHENALMAAHQGIDNYQRMHETILSQRDQLQAQSVCYQDNLTEIQLLKAQVVSREKEVDRMMAQRNLAEAKLLVLEQREVGYLSELDDYARTVLNLRSWVKACQAEHGLQREQP